MIVTCEKCDTSFELDDGLIKESGSEVKCSECENVFMVYKPDAPGEPEAVTESKEEPVDSPSTEEDLAGDIFDADDLGLEDESEESIPEFEEAAAEEPPEAPKETAEEELDFGEISDAIEEPAEEEPVEEDFDLDAIAEAVEQVAEDEPVEELDLGGIDEAPGEVAEAEPVEEELDLEGIGEALEEPTEAEPVEEELDLEGIGEALEEPAEAEPVEELDVGDIGEALEEAAEEKSFDEELDLESISRAVEEAADAPELVSDEMEDEILDFDLIDAEEATPKEVTFEEIGVEEEFTAEEAAPEKVEAPVEIALEPEEEEEEEEEELEEEMPPPVPEDIPAPPSSAMKGPGRQRRIRAPIMILLILGLLGGGAYGGYMYLKSSGTSIPYLEFLTGPEETTTVDPGNVLITVVEQDISTRFVENAVAGRLFVIDGKVRNSYPAARNFIMVKGALYAADGKAVKESMVFCGNVFPDSELQAADKATIDARLRNRFGDQRSNFQVTPGKVLPFMIVFSDLPQEFGEYSVQVVSSAAAQ
ncbi:MAG: zinc-ribbon domain-containing protein [Deltaproteobacteria bacterium]|nr:zinc-ribbon domain-containing protein [Deltaproteobacteria bacterium]